MISLDRLKPALFSHRHPRPPHHLLHNLGGGGVGVATLFGLSPQHVQMHVCECLYRVYGEPICEPVIMEKSVSFLSCKTMGTDAYRCGVFLVLEVEDEA